MPLDTLTDPAIRVTGPVEGRAGEILTPEALAFVADLHRRFDARRLALLAERDVRQKRFDAGETPDFRADTAAHPRRATGGSGTIPAELLDRRVEITGPVDRKMVINALNSGAKVFMADFEDATSPTWTNQVEGQVNLKDLWAGSLSFDDPKSGKAYRLKDQRAVLKVRPRGWHLPERHMTVDGKPVSGALFDFGLYAFHNAQAAISGRVGPVVLPAQAGDHGGGGPVGRRVPPRRRTGWACRWGPSRPPC